MINRATVFSTSWIWLWGIFLSILPHVLNVMSHNCRTLFDWTFFILSTPISITVMADITSILFSATVIFISANVLMFSTVYMEDEKFKDRFTILVLLFVLSMNFLIFIPHFIVLLLGWDGLGIVSFVLVVYYQNPKSLAAGMITALTNRIGDVLLLMSIGLTLNQGQWMMTNMWEFNMSWVQIIFIMAAAMTKSAQMPFSSWLPAAMAAPTPVSALVHSSTLVTAGVFLLIRFYPFLHTLPAFNTTLLVIAVSTMFMAGLSATTECDAKKIIALSTLSQLGMMMTSLGFNMPNLAFFHMVTHALFKALLFVCAGSFIHSHLHTQDLRWMGSTNTQMPIASSCITLANLALCGFPFMAGFYSKDMIIEAALSSPNSLLMLILCMISLGLTSFYSLRFSITVMWSPSLISPYTMIKENMNIVAPMLSLSFMSIVAGAFMTWFNPVSSSMFILPTHMKLMPLVMVTFGLLLGWSISFNSINPSYMLKMNMTHSASCAMWFLVPLSSQFMMKAPMLTAHLMTKNIDHGWLEQFSGLNINTLVTNFNKTSLYLSPKIPSMYIMTSMMMFLMLTALSL